MNNNIVENYFSNRKVAKILNSTKYKVEKIANILNLGYKIPYYDSKIKTLYSNEDISFIKEALESDNIDDMSHKSKDFLLLSDVVKSCNLSKDNILYIIDYLNIDKHFNKSYKRKYTIPNQDFVIIQNFIKSKDNISEFIRKDKSMKKWGVDTPMKSDVVKNKLKESNIKKYGVANVFQSDIIKNKIKETNMKKYGVDNPFKCKDIQDKMKSTCLKKYNVSNFTKTDEYLEKSKNTSLQKYGTLHPSQSSSVKEKHRNFNLKTYGVDWYQQTNEYKEKSKNSWKKRYGENIENPFQSEEVKEQIKNISLQKYGTLHASQNTDVKNKIKNTCLKKYGRSSYLGSVDYIKKSRRKYYVIYNKELKFDSKWEIYYYFYLLDSNINFEYQYPIKYVSSNNTRHTYYCDFYLKDTNELIEIKNPAFLDKNNNLITLYKSGLSQNQIDTYTDINLCKSKCMNDNNVTIITDISFYKDLYEKNHKDILIYKYSKNVKG